MYSVKSVYLALPEEMRTYCERLRALPFDETNKEDCMYESGTLAVSVRKALGLPTRPQGEKPAPLNMLQVLYAIRADQAMLSMAPRSIRMMYHAYTAREFMNPVLDFKHDAEAGVFDPPYRDEEGNYHPGGREPLSEDQYYARMYRAEWLSTLWGDVATANVLTVLLNLNYAMIRGDVSEADEGCEDLNAPLYMPVDDCPFIDGDGTYGEEYYAAPCMEPDFWPDDEPAQMDGGGEPCEFDPDMYPEEEYAPEFLE